MSDFIITSLQPEHVDEVYAISSEAFPLPWSKEDLYREIDNHGAINLVLLNENQVIGYLQCWYTKYDADLLNIAIKPSYKRQYLGEKLLLHLLDKLREIGVENLFLEVRISNLPAQKLYKKLGFITLSMREHYYINGEDAYIMTKQP